MGAKLFVIDGSPAVRRMVEQVSVTEGYEVHTFQDGPSALQAAKKLAPRTVIADFHLDKITFSSFCKELVKLDHMSDTSIISLVDSSDKVDETVYKSLGVAIFLTKPLEPGNLIQTLRDLAEKRSKKAAKSKAKRTWPPVTTGTDLDDEEDVDGVTAQESPAPAAPTPRPEAPAPAMVAPAQVPPAHLENASKTLIDAMAAGVVPQVTQVLMTSLPAMISREIEKVLAARLDEAIRKQLDQAVSPGKISEAVEALVRRDLPGLATKHIADEMGSLKSTILPQMEELSKPMILRATQDAVAERADMLVEKHLPNVVREQMGSIDKVVANTVQELVAPKVHELVESTVKQLAQDRVSESVHHIVPAVAETQIAEEIKRLSALA